MTYRLSDEIADVLTVRIASFERLVCNHRIVATSFCPRCLADHFAPTVETLIAREAAATEAERDYWKQQAEGFLRTATEDLGRYHRLRGLVEALVDKWGWIKDADESPTRYDMWRDLRDALGEARP